MKPSIKTRATAFVASICMTLATVYSVANYAYPQDPPVRLAYAAR
jgi:hypothetical protein